MKEGAGVTVLRARTDLYGKQVFYCTVSLYICTLFRRYLLQLDNNNTNTSTESEKTSENGKNFSGYILPRVPFFCSDYILTSSVISY